MNTKPWFKYSSWVALGLMITLGLTITIYFAVQPKPVPKITYSQFNQTEELPNAIIQRLREEIKESSLIFLGLSPDNSEHYQIWKIFLEDLKVNNIGFDIVVLDPNLSFKNLIPHQEEIDLKTESERLYQGLLAAQTQKKRVAVVLPTLYSTYLIDETPVSRLFKDHQIHGTTFFLSGFPTNADEEARVPYPCVPDQEDRLGARNLGCMIIGKAKTTYRKKLKPGKRAGLVDQVGLSEYMVLFN